VLKKILKRGQHRTVVEISRKLLGEEYAALVEKFEKMRKKRNIFFYESDPFGTLTEETTALDTAHRLVQVIENIIKKENPQTEFRFDPI